MINALRCMTRCLFIIMLALLAADVSRAQSVTQAANAPVDASALQEISASQDVSAPAPQATAEPMRDDDRLPFMQNEDVDAHAPGAGTLLLKTFGAMLLIVGLIVFVGWGLRRFNKSSFAKANTDSPELSVLSTHALGSNRAVCVVRFGARTLLLGSTAHAISLLAIDDETHSKINDETLDAFAYTTIAPRSVADMLKANDRDDASDSGDFTRELTRATHRQVARHSSLHARADWRADDTHDAKESYV